MATTYSQLVTNINNYVIQVSQNFTATIPTFIANAEIRLNREINSQNLTKITNLNATPGKQYLTKPTDWMVTRSLGVSYGGDGEFQLLEKKTLPFIQDYWPNPNVNGTPPLYYMEVNATQIYVAPTPSDVLDFQLFYQFRVPPLSSAAQTNIFTEFYEDILLYACLTEAYKFVMDSERTTLWEMYYQNRLQAINAQGMREERDDMRVLNSFNTSNTVATGNTPSQAP